MSLRQGAKVIAETCMGIKLHENVLIITTKLFSKKARVLAEEAEHLGANVNVVTVKDDEMQIEPPKAVSKMMVESDVIMATLPFSTIQIFLHTNARADATQAGARVGAVPYIKYDITSKDIFEITDLTEKLAEILTNGNDARITTNEGTDITLSIKDRISAPLRVRHVVPGAWGAIPGRAVKIEGKEEAEKIRKIIEMADENGNNIAELGIGTNHTLKRLTGTVGDKMMKGTAHIAIGKNINIGGNTYSNIHHDGVMKNVTIEIDEHEILKDGRILI
jgi:leucyl aminopeptidase (aminopeptidase T)